MSVEKKKIQLNSSMVKEFRPYIIAGLIFAGLEIVGEFLDKLQAVQLGVQGESLGAKDMAFLGIKGLGWWLFLTVFLWGLWKGGKKAYNSRPSGCRVFKSPLLTWLILVVCWIPCFIAYFPGIYSYDGEPQLIQYTSGAFDNHHPVLHTLIMGWCYDLGQWLCSRGINIDGIAFYSILQMALLALALSSVVTYLYRKGVGRVFLWLTMGLFALFPVTPLMAISTTKDTLFTALFVMLIVELLEISEGKEDWKKNGIKAGLIAVFAMLFRRNASYVIIIMTIVSAIVGLVGRRKKVTHEGRVSHLGIRLAIVFLISVVVFEASEKALLTVTDAVPGETAEALSVPLMQIARAFKSNDYEVRIKYGDVIFDYVSETGLCNYRPLISDGVKQYFNNEHFSRDKISFVKLYFNLFKDYPGSYVQAFLYMTKGYWQLMDNSFCEVYKNWWRDRTGYLITDATPIFALDYVKKSNLWPSLRNVYEAFATDCSYRYFFLLQLIFAPAMYVMLVVLGGVALIRNKDKKGILIWLIMGLYLLTMIAGPCVLVRYVFPLMMTSPLLASMVYNEETKTNSGL